ncbi:MAG: hypothetical protein ACREMZ_05900 [Gemmatimonadales bacterium]
MRAMASSWRIAIVLDDEAQRGRFASHIGPGARIYEASGGEELRRLAAARAIDLVIAGVLNRNDEFLSSALRELGRTAPEIVMVGVFEPSRPSLDEAADLAGEVPAMSFAARPGPRFEHLIRPRAPGGSAATFTPALVDCIKRLPLFGAARDFGLLQALHPSLAHSIPVQARELGVSRRNLERWFQGPDICSAGCFQSVCAAGEAAYLRLVGGLAEREIASVVEILTREGVANPMGVPRTIRSALRLGLEELRGGGVAALAQAVDTALRTSRDPTRIPAQWAPDTRYAPEPGVLTISVGDATMLIDPSRGVEQALDQFGMDAWPLLLRGVPFAKLTLELASNRREPPHLVRARLIAWLGELLVRRLIRREPGSAEAGEA